MHRATRHLLQFFEYGHLPEALQVISKPFCVLAAQIAAHAPDNPETTTGLRKLLESKDCIVRAHVARNDDEPENVLGLKVGN